MSSKSGSLLIKPKPRLTQTEIGLALAAVAEGQSQRQVAERLGVTQAAISLIVQKFTPSEHLAKLWVRSSALKVAKSGILAAHKAARHGDAEPALELLDRLDVLAQRRAPSNSDGPKVMIAIGMPGQARLTDDHFAALDAELATPESHA